MENENENSDIIDINSIPDKSFLYFQMSITPQKISDFFKQGIIYNEKSNNSKDISKLNKADFLLIFNSLFSKDINNIIYLNQICLLIFERLKEKKCIFKINPPFSTKNYSLTDITSTEKIEILIVQLFLSAIMITNFKTKLESMFNIIDTDNDKLINEEEIKKLVIITNKLFYEDSKEKFSKSSLIQQAMSNFKANKALSKLLYGKSDLKKLLEKEKYINFEQFYERLIKLDNYMYDIIPMFISLKKFLSNKKEEIEMYLDDQCKKDFVDISYELINKNNLINYISPRNYMKQFFDKKKKIKKKKIDPLKEIKEKKERQKELKMQRLIEMKKREFGKKFNPILRLTLTKSNLSSSDININPQTVKKILDEKEFNYNTPVINNTNTNTNSNKHINLNNEEIYTNQKISENYTKSNNNYKKINTAEYIKKLKLYSKKEKESEKSSEKKLPNSFPLIKETRRKTILNKIFDIPTEVTPFDITEKTTNEKNTITNNNKILSFSSNQNLIDKKEKPISDKILETNFSTLGLVTPILTSNENTYMNFKKIDINNKKQNKDIWQTTNKAPLRKGNKLIEPLSPRYSLINTTSKKYLPNIPFLNSTNKKQGEKSIESGDYYKFSSICFPPCIIKTKEKNNSDSFCLTKEDKRLKKLKRIKKIKYEGFDFSKTLLNTYDEIKNNITDELEQQRNYDLNGLTTILKIKKSILDKTNKFHFVDFRKNKVSFKNFYVFQSKKKK